MIDIATVRKSAIAEAAREFAKEAKGRTLEAIEKRLAHRFPKWEKNLGRIKKKNSRAHKSGK